MKNYRSTITAMACALMLAACANKLTNENLTKVKTGMTQSQVKELLGSPTRTESGATLGVEGATFYYTKSGAEVKIVFLNDSVITKSGSFSN
jgi:outer membrane protein assembly factor BamE (lipoprotein component of BamABCDE complex)